MEQYLDQADIARRWGVKPRTITRYRLDGRLPEPDVVVGSGTRRRFGWKPETIDAYRRPHHDSGVRQSRTKSRSPHRPTR